LEGVADLNVEDKIFWLKAIFALISAVVCSAVGIIGKYGILVTLLIYLATYPVEVFVLKIKPSDAGGSRRMILSGLITYLFIFTAIWGLMFSLTINWTQL
jgi:nitrate reductase NapE component